MKRYYKMIRDRCLLMMVEMVEASGDKSDTLQASIVCLGHSTCDTVKSQIANGGKVC